MTAGYTYEIDKCVAEIHKLAAAGADIVRVAVPEKKDTAALKEILPQVTVPIVADVHFHFQRALEAIEAGVHKIRLNPGNISDRAQVRDVIQACKAKKLPIRIGVNEGSIVERKDKQKRLKELGGVFSDNKHGHFLAIMITKLEEYLEIFHEEDFHDIVISAKIDRPAAGDRCVQGDQQAVRLPAAPGRDARRAQGDRHDPQRRAAGASAVQRHRRHDPHQLRQRSEFTKWRTAWSCSTSSACASASAPS